jgi:hypothetical protein
MIKIGNNLNPVTRVNDNLVNFGWSETETIGTLFRPTAGNPDCEALTRRRQCRLDLNRLKHAILSQPTAIPKVGRAQVIRESPNQQRSQNKNTHFVLPFYSSNQDYQK